ncbi:hypothetical protein Q3G72_002492 [Acer saccharum]|nr:hypothetical protein Q3G72_002492 [Acer saccharum]
MFHLHHGSDGNRDRDWEFIGGRASSGSLSICEEEEEEAATRRITDKNSSDGAMICSTYNNVLNYFNKSARTPMANRNSSDAATICSTYNNVLNYFNKSARKISSI